MAIPRDFSMLVIWSIFCLTVVSSYKVLFIPAGVSSHIVLLSSAADAWVRAGHKAHVVKHHSIPVPTQFKDSGIHYFNFGKKGEEHFTLSKEFTQFVGSMSQKSMIQAAPQLKDMFDRLCTELLRDEELYNGLKKEKYDFVVVDNMPGHSCIHAIAYRLDVPYGSLSVTPPFGMLSNTLQINYLGTTIPFFYSREPNFLYRFIQFLFLQAIQIAMKLTEDTDLINNYLKDKPVNDVSELYMGNKLWLIDMEPLIDAPKHAAPNVIYVGGISAAPINPLPKELQKFADSAKEGLVIVSFGGSLTTDFPEQMLKNLLNGLGSIKYKVIIRLKTKPSYQIGGNILITKWLPQNDLLGHRNTILFITHCGMSSVNEAVHHGVPMLGFPNQDEQRANAYRFSDKNYGLEMDRNNFTGEQLKSTVEGMTSSNKYKNAIGKASAIIKGRRTTSREEAVYWIEHVIKHGGDHLVPFTSKLAWYEVMMYDIALVVILIVAALIFVTVKCCQCTRRLCCGRKRTEKKKKTN